MQGVRVQGLGFRVQGRVLRGYVGIHRVLLGMWGLGLGFEGVLLDLLSDL